MLNSFHSDGTMFFGFLQQYSLKQHSPTPNLQVEELKLYMQETNLSMSIKFKESDVETLNNFSNLMAMLDDTINVATTKFEKKAKYGFPHFAFL